MQTIAPLSAVIATRDRAATLSRTLDSLLTQELVPFEFILVDASDDDATKDVTSKFAERLANAATIRWVAADAAGAAPQRNQGIALSTQPFVWFFDDDILFERGCVRRLWQAIESDATLGGANAMIVNQRYTPPGLLSRAIFTCMHGQREETFAGKVIGPAVNLLPEDRQDLPEMVPVEWLNTTCTIYRREALPEPPFDPFFEGYSLMEDVALSLRVGKKWKLGNVRSAHVRHESGAGIHKSDVQELAEMELLNRHYVMTRILGRKKLVDFLRLALWEIFSLGTALTQPNAAPNLQKMIAGKFCALRNIRTTRNPT